MNSVYLQAPNNLNSYGHLDMEYTIFLAGSITGASDWQEEAAQILLPHFNVFNPRRNNYKTLDPAVEREQISWEHRHLDLAAITLFYFAPETVAPITLLEYGKQILKCKYAPWHKTYVAIHPDYKRKNDVIIQTELDHPTWLANFFDDRYAMFSKIISDYKPRHV